MSLPSNGVEMQIYIARSGETYGPYTADQIRTYLSEGSIVTSDLAWRSLSEGWIPLEQVLASTCDDYNRNDDSNGQLSQEQEGTGHSAHQERQSRTQQERPSKAAMLAKIEEKAREAMAAMGKIGIDEREALKQKALLVGSVKAWQIRTKRKSGCVGFVTGLPGGPGGLAMEAIDLAYLFKTIGKACYGIGHILEKEVDYEHDLFLILGIWSGIAEATGYVAIGKIAVKTPQKVASKILAKGGMKVSARAVTMAKAKALVSVGNKLISKTYFKSSSAAVRRILTKASAKAMVKLGPKMVSKTVPILGGVVGAGVNVWMINSILRAAEQYYSNEYIVFDEQGFA